MTQSLKHTLSILFSTLAGGLLMYWLYRDFNWSILAEVFAQRSNFFWITLTIPVGVTANLLRSLRWRMLLQSSHIYISKRRSVELVFMSYLINAVTPRLGELTRSLLVKRGDSAVTTRALGTVVVEKLADVACLAVVVGCAVALRWSDTVGLAQSMTEGIQWAVPHYSFYVALGCLVCLTIGVSFPLWRHIKRFLKNLWQGISAIVKLRRPWAFITLCFGIWLCNFMQLYLLMPCFAGIDLLSFGDGLYIFATASVGVLLPTPGGAGPWHFAVVKTMTLAFGIAKGTAQSFALVTHGVKTLLVMLLGVWAYVSYYTSHAKRP